ncbi:hypothetical protein J2S74_005210 [Evansella vedderi]|uniref:Uncharacterized protein n=1 Tax=Evansella vedderi TaxID=38282 RepID=A0ABU0A2N5_9BACI|nr:hypothetical protein [Evansella vedderi]MDQ0257748.1 hypothetical protein [Evansella vedderi]
MEQCRGRLHCGGFSRSTIDYGKFKLAANHMKQGKQQEVFFEIG